MRTFWVLLLACWAQAAWAVDPLQTIVELNAAAQGYPPTDQLICLVGAMQPELTGYASVQIQNLLDDEGIYIKDVRRQTDPWDPDGDGRPNFVYWTDGGVKIADVIVSKVDGLTYVMPRLALIPTYAANNRLVQKSILRPGESCYMRVPKVKGGWTFVISSYPITARGDLMPVRNNLGGYLFDSSKYLVTQAYSEGCTVSSTGRCSLSTMWNWIAW